MVVVGCCWAMGFFVCVLLPPILSRSQGDPYEKDNACLAPSREETRNKLAISGVLIAVDRGPDIGRLGGKLVEARRRRKALERTQKVERK